MSAGSAAAVVSTLFALTIWHTSFEGEDPREEVFIVFRELLVRRHEFQIVFISYVAAAASLGARWALWTFRARRTCSSLEIFYFFIYFFDSIE